MRHTVFQKPHCNKKVKLLLLHERYHYRLLSVETVFGLIKYLIRVRLEHICGYLFTAVSRQAMLNHTAAVCNRRAGKHRQDPGQPDGAGTAWFDRAPRQPLPAGGSDRQKRPLLRAGPAQTGGRGRIRQNEKCPRGRRELPQKRDLFMIVRYLKWG